MLTTLLKSLKTLQKRPILTKWRIQHKSCAKQELTLLNYRDALRCSHTKTAELTNNSLPQALGVYAQGTPNVNIFGQGTVS
ncbi:hypothetical protein ALQ03_200082 [Pseudomonas savastanoi pv. glycinea]|nr:hypothetical protein ALQ03_200082 [Pseudomonas savastanoi pv. glycinea]RMR40078.1 hypothetical protein ALP88_200043 [Pseudomonas savastanoi pv. glycinea]